MKINSIFLILLIAITKENAAESFEQVPVRLQPGDVCQIVAPLSPGVPDLLNETVQFVSDLGLTPRITDGIYSIIGPGEDLGDLYYSNTDEFRAQDIANAILSDDVKIIWLINGGSGAYRTLDGLEKLLPPPPLPPKIVIGFSAVTSIFSFLIQKYNWPAIHGAVLDLIVQNYYENSTSITVDPLRDLIFGNVNKTTVPLLTRVDNGPALESPLTSTVVGGSFRQIALSIGTPYKLDTNGRILFLEMFDRDPNSCQDFMDSLLFSGTFDNVTAIVFGDFMADYVNPPEKIEWVVNRFANENPRVTAPVFRLSGIGHGFTNHPLPLNTIAEISLVEGNTYALTVDNVY